MVSVLEASMAEAEKAMVKLMSGFIATLFPDQAPVLLEVSTIPDGNSPTSYQCFFKFSGEVSAWINVNDTSWPGRFVQFDPGKGGIVRRCRGGSPLPHELAEILLGGKLKPSPTKVHQCCLLKQPGAKPPRNTPRSATASPNGEPAAKPSVTPAMQVFKNPTWLDPFRKQLRTVSKPQRRFKFRVGDLNIKVQRVADDLRRQPEQSLRNNLGEMVSRIVERDLVRLRHISEGRHFLDQLALGASEELPNFDWEGFLSKGWGNSYPWPDDPRYLQLFACLCAEVLVFLEKAMARYRISAKIDPPSPAAA